MVDLSHPPILDHDGSRDLLQMSHYAICMCVFHITLIFGDLNNNNTEVNQVW